MSRPEVDGVQIQLPPNKFLGTLSMRYEPCATRTSYDYVKGRVKDLGLYFSDQELAIIAALDTPTKVQDFLDNEVYYNDDHGSHAVRGETAMAPRQVLQTGYAHCFEAALFAYAVNYIHRHNPKLVLLESQGDLDHNIVVYRNPISGLLGANAHSRYEGLNGKSAQASSLHDLAVLYTPYYFSTETNDPADTTLVGYSEPIDLVARFGTVWMGEKNNLWNMYWHYVTGKTKFYYLDQTDARPHKHPLNRAIDEGWISIGADNLVALHIDSLPLNAPDLWRQFHKEFKREDVIPRGKALDIAHAFVQLTGTTPLDLMGNARELQNMVNLGFQHT